MARKASDVISGFGAVHDRPMSIPENLTGIKPPAQDRAADAVVVSADDLKDRLEYEAAMAQPSKRFKTEIAALAKAGITNREHAAVFEAAQDMLRTINNLRLAPEYAGQFPTMAVYVELSATVLAAVAHTYMNNADKADMAAFEKTGELTAKTRAVVGLTSARAIEILQQAIMEKRPVI